MSFVKMILLAGTCMALAVPAEAAISGYGELYGGIDSGSISYGRWITGPVSYQRLFSREFAPSTIAGGLHAADILDSGLGVQFDVQGANYFLKKHRIQPYEEMVSQSTFGLAGHLNRREESYLWGGFASIGKANNSGWVALGPEVQAYFGNFTLYSQASYTRSFQGKDCGEGAFSVHTGARYFLSDHLAFSGGLGAAISDYDDTGKTSGDRAGEIGHTGMLQWDVAAEYLFGASPFSLFATYRGDRQLWRGDYPTSYVSILTRQWKASNQFFVGVRLYLGQNSLIENERKGAGLNDYNPFFGAQPSFADHDRDYYGPPI